MKYILAKDLPFAKKGDKVIINDTRGYGDEVSIHIPLKSGTGWENYLGIKKDLLKDGWIEEVKPREIWLNKFETGVFAYGWFCSEENAKTHVKANWLKPDDIKQIKFIEITDED